MTKARIQTLSFAVSCLGWIGLVSLSALAQQSPPPREKVGVLSCAMSGSIGLIVGSRQRLRCRFDSGADESEFYFGTITRLGLDLGITGGGAMSWAVFAPSIHPGRGALAGAYVGASADVALGIGLGANALIGGSNRTVALQPLSVEAQVGVNLALGVAGLNLQSAP